MVENEHLEKNLQALRKEAKQLRATMENAVFALGEMRTVILAEVLTFGETMQKLYDGFFTVHKTFVHFHGIQQ